MASHGSFTALSSKIRKTPLQAAKFVSILLSLGLGIAGFFRLIDATAIIGGPGFGDGQFLALILIPIASFFLVFVVFLETLVTGYRILRSKEPIMDQLNGRVGYLVIRGVEAAIAIVGMTIISATLPLLFAGSTPAPAGVGLMLLLMGVGIAILVASFIRASAELYVYDNSAIRN